MKPPARDPAHAPLLAGLAAGLFLIALTLVAYWQVRAHDFVNYDDFRYVVENPHVRAGLTRSGLAWAFANLEAGFWHPLTWMSHMLDCQLYGLNPGGHHLTNLLFHVANSLLLFWVLKRMTGALWKSWFVAALFALHPLHVESVAWVSQRKDVLSALFWMITLWSYHRYVERPGIIRYLAVLLCFVLGLMAKTMVVTLPLVLLLLDYWPLGRTRPDRAKDRSPVEDPESAAPLGRGAPVGRLILEKVPLLVLSAMSVLLTFHAESLVGALSTLDSIPLTTRAANALVSYGAYLGKTFFPRHLSVIYLYPVELPLWETVGSLMLLGALTALVFLGSRRWPYLPVGWFWYLGTLVPVIGLVRIGSHGMADRYTYLPHIGLFLMAAWGVPRLLKGWTHQKVLLTCFAATVLAVLTLATWMQVRHWRNSVTLFEHAIEVTRGNFLAHKNLGFVFFLEGRLSEAERHLRESLRFNPDYAMAHFHLANVLNLQGRSGEALRHYARTVEIQPGFARSHHNMGDVLVSLGRTDEAISHYRKALEIDPRNGDTHTRLGLALLREGKTGEAVHAFAAALRLDPDDPVARRNLIAAQRRSGRTAGE